MWTVSWIYTHCCVQKAPRCSFRVNGSLWNNWAWKRGKTSSIGDCRVYPTEMVLDVRQQCWNLETDLPYGGGLSQDFPALVDLLIWNSILCSKWVTAQAREGIPFQNGTRIFMGKSQRTKEQNYKLWKLHRLPAVSHKEHQCHWQIGYLNKNILKYNT